MSMECSTTTTVHRTRNRIWMSLWLARFVQQTREAMGLSIKEAAYVAGIEASRWCALEGGWVPADEDPVLRSAAETLEVDYLQISLLATISRHNQALPL